MKIKSITVWAVIDKSNRIKSDNVWKYRKNADFVVTKKDKIIKVKIVPVNDQPKLVLSFIESIKAGVSCSKLINVLITTAFKRSLNSHGADSLLNT